MSSDDIYLILFSMEQKTKWNRCYFNNLEAGNCDLPCPSFDFLLNSGIFCWLNPRLFFPNPGQLFGLLGNSCQFSALPISQETCSHQGPGSIPPRVLNALTFSHTAFARLHAEVQLRQESSLHHQWALKRCQRQWERLSTYLRSRWHNERFYYVYQVNGKTKHFWNIRKLKVPLFTCSLKAKSIYPFVWPDLVKNPNKQGKKQKGINWWMPTTILLSLCF